MVNSVGKCIKLKSLSVIISITSTHRLYSRIEPPLLKDTPNKGHNTFSLSACKGQILWSLQYHGNAILPLKEDNLSIKVKFMAKIAGPQVSII